MKILFCIGFCFKREFGDFIFCCFIYFIVLICFFVFVINSMSRINLERKKFFLIYRINSLLWRFISVGVYGSCLKVGIGVEIEVEYCLLFCLVIWYRLYLFI